MACVGGAPGEDVVAAWWTTSEWTLTRCRSVRGLHAAPQDHWKLSNGEASVLVGDVQDQVARRLG